MPDVTVSIVAGGEGRLLEACLASLPGAARTTTLQTIVVDNASPDGEVTRCCEGYSSARSIRLDRNRGFSGPCNIAAAEALAGVAGRGGTIVVEARRGPAAGTG